MYIKVASTLDFEFGTADVCQILTTIKCGLYAINIKVKF